ncbi:MAG: efflux RND transporter periplasmic adaptor subunit [Thermodesulfobacteriota bacterium]
MKRGLAVGIILLVLGAGFWGCSKPKEEPKVTEKSEVRSSIAVEVAQVQAGDLVEGIEIVGSLTPKFEANIKSEYAGIVTDVYVTEWVRVKKGTPLAKLDSREIEAMVQKAQAAVELGKANLLQSEVAGNRAEREFARAQNLKEAGLITQQNLDDAQTEKAAASARISAAKAQLLATEKDLRQAQTRMAKAIIHSPLDGVVSSRNVNVGDLVGEPGATRIMFQIVDNRLLELTVTVPSIEMGRLRLGQPLTFFTDAFPGKTFSGQIKYINPAVSEADRSVKVIAEVPNNPEVLKGGLYVKGRIITGQRRDVLQIPRSALLSWDVGAKKGEVFIVHQDQAFRQSIQTGSLSGERVEVVSGIQKGEWVITRGGFNVKNGDRVKITPMNGGK